VCKIRCGRGGRFEGEIGRQLDDVLVFELCWCYEYSVVSTQAGRQTVLDSGGFQLSGMVEQWSSGAAPPPCLLLLVHN